MTKKMMLLENEGNSCFINSAIQMIDDLSLEMKRSRHKPKERSTRMLLQLLGNRNENDELSEILGMFYKGVQSDADEFLKCMLDLLVRESYISNTVSEVTQFLQQSIIDRNHFRLVKENVMESNTIDIFIKDCNTIQECLDKSQRDLDELESGDYNYTHKRITYKPSGQDLVITLKRYDYTGAKLQRKIIPDRMITFGTARYYLKSCIIHIGRHLSSGHYTYLTFDDDGEAETYISDDNVLVYRKNQMNDYLKNGYIYLYKKKSIVEVLTSRRKKIGKRKPTIVQRLLQSSRSRSKRKRKVLRSYSGSIKRY